MGTIFENFTKQYAVSKTLRFELIPVEATKNLIQEAGEKKNILKEFLDKDRELQKEYSVIKKLIDEYHKDFIDKSLNGFSLDSEKLKKYHDLFFQKKEKDEWSKFNAIKSDLRKDIARQFSEQGDYKYLDVLELLNEKNDKKDVEKKGIKVGNIIPKWLDEPISGNQKKIDLVFEKLNDLIKKQFPEHKSDEERRNKLDEIIDKFKRFFSYLKPFCENRKEILYSSRGKKNTIVYRLIDENLPKFLFNITVYERIKDKEFFQKAEKELKEKLKSEAPFSLLADFFSLDAFNKTITQKGIDKYNLIRGGRKPKDENPVEGLNQHINKYNQTQEENGNKIPQLKKLDKQILSDSESSTYSPEPFESDKEALENIKAFYEDTLFKNSEIKIQETDILKEIDRLLKNIRASETDKIFVKEGFVGSISSAIFGNRLFIQNALIEHEYGKVETGNPVHALNKIIEELKGYDENMLNAADAKSQKKLEKEKKQLESKRKKLEKALSDIQKKIENADRFSVLEIETALFKYKDTLSDETDEKRLIKEHTLCDYFAKAEKPDSKDGEEKNLFKRIENAYGEVKELLDEAQDKDEKKYRLGKPKQKDYEEEDSDEPADNSEVGKVQRFLGSIKELLAFVKPFDIGTEESAAKYGSAFYDRFDELYEQLAGITDLYFKTQSRLMKKEFSTDSIRLMFGKSTLLNGFSISNGNTQYQGYLFRKNNSIGEYDYFLGISADATLFPEQDEIKGTASEYERLYYMQKKTSSFYGSSYRGKFGLYFKEEKDGLSQTAAIDRLKLLLKEKYKNVPNNKPVMDGSFQTLQDFKNAVSSLFKQNKVLEYGNISKGEFEKALKNEDKPLFLFKINNKDLSYADTYAKGLRNKENKPRGKENLHTMYFRHLMSGDQSVIDLGTGMLFWRDASIPRKITHHAKAPVESKRWRISKAGKQFNQFDYDLYKDKRFTYVEENKSEGKYFLHLSTVINYQSPDAPKKTRDFNEAINQNVLSYLKEQADNPDFNIIGIDRGERHLLYVSVIDQQGNIRDKFELAPNKSGQFSLNKIYTGYRPQGHAEEIPTDYKTLLQRKGAQKKKAQQGWGEAVNIKELKQGYLSQVIHQISKMMIKDGKPNAIIVMEALNPKFKQKRPLDTSVYQIFEKMLIEKLNYLTFKDTTPTEPGGILNGWQFTGKYDVDVLDKQKQCGFVFYVPAAYTSKIDPASGFVNFFSNLPYGNISKSKNLFEKFERVEFKNGRFEFEFDYGKFKENAPKAAGELKWKVCTSDETRYVWNRYANNNKGAHEKLFVFNKEESLKSETENVKALKGNVTEQLKYLFRNVAAINYENCDLREEISKRNNLKSDFYDKLLKLFSATLSLRQNNGEKGDKEEDKIISPVNERNGKPIAMHKQKLMPDNADANGAYHIALKGLWYLQRIQEDKFEEMRDDPKRKKDKKGFPSTEEWLEFAQQH